MKGLFIPEITAEMFKSGCLESIEALMAAGEIYDIEYQRWIPCSERLPAADVQPVRHGHWLRTGRTNVYGGFEVECSVCNDSVMITNIEYEHYCRNCGARMDEEEVSE